MVLLDNIKTFINNIEIKTFYHYILGYIIACVLLSGATVFYYYRTTNALYKKIKSIKDSREEVLVILEKAGRVQQEQIRMDDILSKDIDFTIGGYFIKLLDELDLKNKEIKTGEVNSTVLENNYRKTELSTHFEDMTMQELTILLQALEKNPRIATDLLEITKSKKKPKTIEVNLSISTLLPKLETTSV
jgi:hypothetical protein